MGRKILIAEDERPLSKILKVKLEKEGITADIASTGQEAIDLLQNNQYELLLLDIVMPMKNGFEVLREMQALNVQTPVIVLTNLGQDSDVNEIMELGAMECHVKADASLIEVVERVKDILG